MKYLSNLVLLTLIALISVVFSCNSAPEKTETNVSGGVDMSKDTAAVAPASDNPKTNNITPAPIDSLRVDTAKVQPVNTVGKEVKQMGSAAYYCPSKMIKDQDYFVTVSISKGSLQNLIEQIKEDTKAINPSAKMGDVKGDSVPIADRMKVELIFSEVYFSIVHAPSNLEQDFTGTDRLDWEWLVEPKAAISKIPIQVKISGYNLEKNKWIDVIHPGKTFYINVQIDPRSFWIRA